MEIKGVLLDTSFFIRLLNEKDPLHGNILGYFRYFLEKGITLKMSTIAIGEFCVKGELNELPIEKLQILPFNLNHAERAGKLASIVYGLKDALDLPDRKLVSNDTKMFAQADVEPQVEAYVTSDERCLKVVDLLKQHTSLNFLVINLRIPYNETFGLLDVL